MVSLILPLGISLVAVITTPQQAGRYSFEITIKASTPGIVQLFYDPSGGDGIRESDSARLDLREIDTATTHRFALPEGTYKGFRFDPIDREGAVRFSGARVVRSDDSAGEEVVQAVPVTRFQVAPNSQVRSFTIDRDEAQLVTVDKANDPILLVAFDAPLTLKRDQSRELIRGGKSLIGLTLLMWLAFWLIGVLHQRSRARLEGIWARSVRWGTSNPGRAVLAVAVFATILSTYPVVFFGRSFVSPNHGTVLLYDKYPTLPGYDVADLEDNRRADVGAPMWAHLPYSVVESNAILHDGEWPLWNRFNSGGVTLLGQGQSMFGDPLHVGVLLAKGASWAWDAKYVLAKGLFVLGLGLTVLACTGHLGVALTLTLSSAYIGFFAFRLSHPAFFSLAYSPWILLCWIRFIQAPFDQVPSQVRWLCGLVLANFTVMNSGTAKEAYMLLVFLNLTGGLIFLFQPMELREKLVKGARLAFAQILFVLISAPVWLTFLQAIRKSYSSYATPAALQISPDLLLGLFDDLFYRQLMTPDGEYAPAPSANFLILAGVLWALVGFRRLTKDPAYLGVAAGAAMALSLVFGVIPPSVVSRIPFLGNVIHIHNTFSVVAIVHLIVLAGFGLKALCASFGKRRWPADFGVTLAIVFGFLVFYIDGTREAEKSVFFVEYGASLVLALIGLPLVARRLWLGPATSNMLILVVVCFVALHWRHGMYLKTRFDDQVMNPQLRVDLHPKSPAIDFIKAGSGPPFRAVGFDGNLFAGYNAAIGVESIYGPDALRNPYYRELLKLLPIELGWDWKVIVQKKDVSVLRPVYDLLNVRDYLSLPVGSPAELQGLRLAGRFDLDVYRSETAWPRAFFTNQLRTYETAAEFAAMALGHDGQPFAAVQGSVLREHPALQALLTPRLKQVAGASQFELTNNTTAFTVIAPEGGVIVLTEAYSADDFEVTLNGKPTNMLRVNHAFKGVQIDGPGEYRVTFSYWPRRFSAALAASGVGLLLLLVWLFGRGVEGSRLVPRLKDLPAIKA
jgi:hypothetical protein